jgi:carbonic anhydrase/acetyltransferase-like protein (isoleucine patch superfamily)
VSGAKIGKGSVIAAGALVPEGMEVPPASMVMGVPARVKREVTSEEQERFRNNAQNYVRYRETYREEPS